jgi:hypothetical protein
MGHIMAERLIKQIGPWQVTTPDPKFFAMQVANAVIPSGFAETASGIWVKAERSPDGPSGLGLTGVHGQKISDPGYY